MDFYAVLRFLAYAVLFLAFLTLVAVANILFTR